MLDTGSKLTQHGTFFTEADINIEDFKTLCAQSATLTDYPNAEQIEQNIVIYSGDKLRTMLANPTTEAEILAEIARCMVQGPGVFGIKGAYTDNSVIDAATDIFFEIIAEEKAAGHGEGDHFGNNERIWNSIQKACIKDPDLFIDYYGNPLMALAAQAWLGHNYQVTAQVNNVKPHSKAQSVHRDYHLGFQTPEIVAGYPAHAQIMSQYLTLQGAIAHIDMPLEMGPTLLLPFSHHYPAGYMAYRKPEFVAYFEEHHSQIPLSKGDMVYFSPALFHGAGTNITDKDRLVNLVQISSAFGRTMENLDQDLMITAVYPALLKRKEEGNASDRLIANTITACAEGYSFPTNLDTDPPVAGIAPKTSQQIMHTALQESWSLDQHQAELDARTQRRGA